MIEVAAQLACVHHIQQSYFDQATEIARLLNIKLTSRPFNKGRIPMCGFPLMHLDKSLKILVQQNKRFVAMCEEFPRFVPGMSKPEFDRRVVRVITPGTLIDEPFLNQYENNYLLSISSHVLSLHTNAEDVPRAVGLAWIDVSTGEFFVKSSTYDSLRDELARIGPKEVVLDKYLELHPSHPIRMTVAEEDNFVSYIVSSEAPMLEHSPHSKEDADDVTAPVDEEDSLTPSISALNPYEASAISLLTTFLNANLLEHMPTLSLPNREGTTGRMQIDSHTIRALEIRGGATEGTTKGSLLSVVKRTVTSSGTRLLARWLCMYTNSHSKCCYRYLLSRFTKYIHQRDQCASIACWVSTC
jgi:DNA mismatch repair ATPase MutS